MKDRIGAIVIRQFYLIRDNPARFFQLFVWMTLDVVLWGFITRYLTQFAPNSPVPSLLGAIILFDFLQRAMQGVTMAFFEDVWSRNFLNLFASPLTNFEYLAGLVISSICTTALVFVIIVGFAAAFFGLPAIMFGAYLAPFLLILFTFGIALGVIGVSIVLRFGPSAEWFVWPMPAILAPFVGVTYPASTLPLWMQSISRLLAPSYVFDGLRALVTTGSFDHLSLVVSLALALATLGLAYWLFVRVYKHAVRSGAIARYSAESFS